MIYVFIAPGFEEIEALGTVDILRRAGLDVQTVGIGGKEIAGAHRVPVTCDITGEEAVTDGLEMIVMPGGMPGAKHLEESPVVQKLIDYASANDLWIAAICAAPTMLARKGLLDGKNATCYPTRSAELDKAVYSQERVAQDGKIVTGKGPGASIAFGLKLVECLCGAEKAGQIEAALQ